MHKLDSIAENVKVCEKCKLCETRTKAVPGKGRFDADVIFVEKPQAEMKICMESHLSALQEKGLI